MGKGNNLDIKTETAADGNGGNTSTSSAKSGGRTGGRTAGTKDVKSDIVPKVVVVDLPGEEKEEKEKPKRGRPPGSKAKPKATAAKKTAAAIDHKQISVLLKTVSDIAAARPGMEIWKLSQEEVDQVAKPLAEIMKRHEAIGNATSEYADYIALVTVCMSLFIPRYMMHKAMNPKKVKEGKINYGTTQQQQQQQPRNNARPTEVSPQRSNGQTPGNGSTIGSQLSQLIPSIG